MGEKEKREFESLEQDLICVLLKRNVLVKNEKRKTTPTIISPTAGTNNGTIGKRVFFSARSILP